MASKGSFINDVMQGGGEEVSNLCDTVFEGVSKESFWCNRGRRDTQKHGVVVVEQSRASIS